MARTIGVIGTAALSRGDQEIAKPARRTFVLGRWLTSLLRGYQDREIERYIRQRGGVMTDDIDRELSRHFGRM